MAITVEIAGIDRTDEWTDAAPTGWNDQLNGRGTGRITFNDDVGGFFPDDGQTIEIIEDGTVRFGGILMEPTITEPGGDESAHLFFGCQMSDYNILCDRRTVGEEFENVDFDLIVSGIVTNWMDGEGISLAGVEADVALTVSFGNIPVTDAFNALSDATGKFWYIDENKVLNFKDRDTDPAPFDMDGDTLLAGTITVREDRQKYRNEQIVRSGNDDFPILAVSGDLTEQAARAAIEDTSGIYSEVFDDETITNQTIALEKAGDLLNRFAEIGKVVTGRTRLAGFRAGQEVNVHLPDFGVTNTLMLIDTVDAEIISTSDGDEVWYMLRAITGDPFGGWMEHFRKLPPIKVPLTFENTPGLFRVDPKPGAVVHDPEPDSFEWVQAATSVPTESPNSFGILHDGSKLLTLRFGGLANTDGCSGGQFPGFGGSPACFDNRQVILEVYDIDEDNVVATTPEFGISTDAANVGSNFKPAIVISPDDRFAAIGHMNTPGVDSVFYIYDINAGTFRGQVISNMLTNSNLSEPIWVGDNFYFVDGSQSIIHNYNVSDPNTPVEAEEFATSVTLIRSLVASPDGSVLYGVGSDDAAAFDKSDPDNLVEDTALVLSGGMRSVGIRDDGTALVAIFRFSGAELRYNTLTMTKNGTDIVASTTDGVINLATVVMDGLACIWHETTAICWSQVPSSPANSTRAHIFDMTDIDDVTFQESLSYNHGVPSNQGPIRGYEASKVFFNFGGLTWQITFGEVFISESVPLTIDCPLRVGFGGTGIAKYLPGDLIYASRVLPDDNRGQGNLTRLGIENFGDVLMISGELPVWQSFAETAAFVGLKTDQLLFTTSDVTFITSGSIADVDELEADVLAGQTYYFRAELFFDADPVLGHRWGMGGTATGDVIYQIRTLDDDTGEYSILESGQKTALGEDAGEVGATNGYTEISGSIEVTADGTLVPRFGAF